MTWKQRVKVWQGNIVTLDVDAIVNAANDRGFFAHLRLPSGVSAQIADLLRSHSLHNSDLLTGYAKKLRDMRKTRT